MGLFGLQRRGFLGDNGLREILDERDRENERVLRLRFATLRTNGDRSVRARESIPDVSIVQGFPTGNSEQRDRGMSGDEGTSASFDFASLRSGRTGIAQGERGQDLPPLANGSSDPG